MKPMRIPNEEADDSSSSLWYRKPEFDTVPKDQAEIRSRNIDLGDSASAHSPP